MPEQIVWVRGDPYRVQPGKSCHKCDLVQNHADCRAAQLVLHCMGDQVVLKESDYPLETYMEGIDEQCGVGNG